MTDVNAETMFYTAPASKSARCLVSRCNCTPFLDCLIARLSADDALLPWRHLCLATKRDVIVFHFPGNLCPLWQHKKRAVPPSVFALFRHVHTKSMNFERARQRGLQRFWGPSKKGTLLQSLKWVGCKEHGA